MSLFASNLVLGATTASWGRQNIPMGPGCRRQAAGQGDQRQGDRDNFTSALYMFNGDEHTIDETIVLISIDYRSYSDLGEAVKAALARADELMKGRC